MAGIPAVITYGRNHVLVDGPEGRWTWLYTSGLARRAEGRTFPSYAAARRFMRDEVVPLMLRQNTRSELRRLLRVYDAA